MEQNRILKNKSQFLSSYELSPAELFNLSEPGQGFSKTSLVDLMLRRLLGVKSSAKVSVSKYYTNNILNNKGDLFRRSGNLKKLEPVSVRNDYPKLFLVCAEYSDIVGLRRSKGASFSSQSEASLKAFGEYLERFYGFFSDHPLKRFYRPKVSKFVPKKSSLRVSFLPVPTMRQVKHNFFPKDTQSMGVLDASWALNLTKNRKELLPLSTLYYGVSQPLFLQPTTTNGGGGGFSLTSSRLSAVYELIERDHFLLFWVTGTHPELIVHSSLPEELSKRVNYLQERYNLVFYILDTTYEIDIFSCMVFVVDPVLCRISVGGAAGISIAHTINKALTEAITELHFSQEKEIQDIFSFTSVKERPFLNEHISKNVRKDFYNNQEGVLLLKSLFLEGREKSYKDLTYLEKEFVSEKEELSFVDSAFNSLSVKKGDGYNLYFFEYQGQLLDDFNYHVSKAFIPSFLKLWLEENNATPCGVRVKDFCEHHGKVYREEDLNPYPHPLS